MKGVVFDIKELGVHDGPGLRTTVFMKGCPLRCVWCHNPEGLKREPELMHKRVLCKACGACRLACSHKDCEPFGRCLHICPEGALSVVGREMTDTELCERIMRNYRFIREGGVTFSGGEPLMQWEFILSVISLLKGRVKVAIETSGYAKSEVFERVINEVDLVYMDIKTASEDLHIKYTGVSNKLILENLEILKKSGVRYILRTPIVPGINDSEDEKNAILRIAEGSEHEFLPFNEMAGAKYEMLGESFPYDEILNEG